MNKNMMALNSEKTDKNFEIVKTDSVLAMQQRGDFLKFHEIEKKFTLYREQLNMGESALKGAEKKQIFASDGTEARTYEHFINLPFESAREGIKGFENGRYQVVEAEDDVTLYRAQSYEAVGGNYFTDVKPVDKIDTKLNSALSNIWAADGAIGNYNTREYIETVTFPAGTKFYVGTVGGQPTIGTPIKVDNEGKNTYPLPGGNLQFVPYEADWMDKIPKENVSVEKFDNVSGYKEFSKKANKIETENNP